MNLIEAREFERDWVNPPLPGGQQVHAPSVIMTEAGLLAAWFSGEHEGASDNRIYLSRRVGGKWSAPVVVADFPAPHWNPVFGRNPTNGELWLFFKRGTEISAWQTWYVTSTDEGLTWSPAQQVAGTEHLDTGPVKNAPLNIQGRWLAPGSSEVWQGQAKWDAFVDISEDGGVTWKRSPIPAPHETMGGAGLIQPALWEGEKPGIVHALMRGTEGSAFGSVSNDYGKTWETAHPTDLPNNNSALSVAQIEPGVLLCAYNPVSGDWAPRCPLGLALSTDYGATWKQVAIIDDGVTPIDDDPGFQPRLPGEDDLPVGQDTGVLTEGIGEYSYPSIIIEDGTVTVCYTWQRRRIVCAELPVQQIWTQKNFERDHA